MAGYTIDDPRPRAAESPYTFFLPQAEALAVLGPGDLAKLIFRSDEPGEYDAERMWVRIDQRDGEHFTGTLDNDPTDTPALKEGDTVAFSAHHVIAIYWQNKANAERFARDTDGWFARCFVDDAVLRGEARVQYLYREAPEHDPDDSYPDTGWRIRADVEALSEEEYENPVVRYVAIGAVLNRDPSFVDLLGSPVGSAFFRESGGDTFEPTERSAPEDDGGDA